MPPHGRYPKMLALTTDHKGGAQSAQATNVSRVPPLPVTGITLTGLGSVSSWGPIPFIYLGRIPPNFNYSSKSFFTQLFSFSSLLLQILCFSHLQKASKINDLIATHLELQQK